jgi:hypothetical protein
MAQTAQEKQAAAAAAKAKAAEAAKAKAAAAAAAKAKAADEKKQLDAANAIARTAGVKPFANYAALSSDAGQAALADANSKAKQVDDFNALAIKYGAGQVGKIQNFNQLNTPAVQSNLSALTTVRDTPIPEGSGLPALTPNLVKSNPELALGYGTANLQAKEAAQTLQTQKDLQTQSLDYAQKQFDTQMQWQKDQAAAAKLAQDTAQYQSMQNAAQQSALQGQQQAAQQLGLQNQYQQMQDANAIAQQKQQAAAAGTAAAGGGFNINSAQNAQAANLGMRTGSIPVSAANQPAGAPKMANQVGGTGQAGFKMPQTSGIKFGGI